MAIDDTNFECGVLPPISSTRLGNSQSIDVCCGALHDTEEVQRGPADDDDRIPLPLGVEDLADSLQGSVNPTFF